MATGGTMAEGGTAEIRRLGRPGDLGWVVLAHGEQYATEFGWDTSFEALVARIVADYAVGTTDGEAAWIAELDGRRVGCVFCVRAGPGTAQLRILLVDPMARGHGLGARLVATCIRFAQGAGYPRLRLWTNDPLVSARRLYLAAGFTLVAEERHHSFGIDLIGQHYQLDLRAASAPERSSAAEWSSSCERSVSSERSDAAVGP